MPWRTGPVNVGGPAEPGGVHLAERLTEGDRQLREYSRRGPRDPLQVTERLRDEMLLDQLTTFHRGVEVVGAWGWIATLGIGVAFEERRDEALELYYVLRQVYWSLGMGYTQTQMFLSGQFRSQQVRRS